MGAGDADGGDAPQARRGGGTRRLTRSTAGRLLVDLLARVKALNQGSYYLYNVDEVVVFGSYLDEALERIGDLDVAIRFSAKITDRDVFDKLCEERSASAERHFDNYVEYAYWPLEETFRFLRGGSKAIRLHDIREVEKLLAAEPPRTIYP